MKKISEKRQEQVKQEAFWTVLINCPFGEKTEWIQARNELLKRMYCYFAGEIENSTICHQFRVLIRVDMQRLSVKAYNGKNFKDLPDHHQFDDVYTCLRNLCSTNMLYHFYKYAVLDKPTQYCSKTKRFI